jgi:ubiquitin-protein ligase
MTPHERNLRLAHDYEEMCAIRGAMIHWVATGGQKPSFDRYSLTVRVRTIVGPRPDYANETRFDLQLPNDYPKVAPIIRSAAEPIPFHPNWWTDGRWCHGTWAPAETLGHFVVRMVRILQFDQKQTNVKSPANAEATVWWNANLHRGWFPCDRQILPDPTVKRRIKITSVSR